MTDNIESHFYPEKIIKNLSKEKQRAFDGSHHELIKEISVKVSGQVEVKTIVKTLEKKGIKFKNQKEIERFLEKNAPKVKGSVGTKFNDKGIAPEWEFEAKIKESSFKQGSDGSGISTSHFQISVKAGASQMLA